MIKQFLNQAGHFIVVVVFFVAVLLIGTGVFGGTLLARWYYLMGTMVVLLAALGKITTNRWDGVLIDWRNKMSLSRLQVIIWTILGVSAFLVMGLGRTVMFNEDKLEALDLTNAAALARQFGGHDCVTDIADENIADPLADCPAPAPLEIVFPEELLLAMGISVASFAGSAIIKRNNSTKDASGTVGSDKIKQLNTEIEKAQKAETDAALELQRLVKQKDKHLESLEVAKAADNQNAILLVQSQIEDVERSMEENRTKSNEELKKRKDLEAQRETLMGEKYRGTVHVNATTELARWADMFEEEGKTHQRLDLSKVQMFFITIAVVAAYAAGIGSMLGDSTAMTNPFGVLLPPFSSSLVTLLGISHGGYLTIKSTPEPD